MERIITEYCKKKKKKKAQLWLGGSFVLRIKLSVYELHMMLRRKTPIAFLFYLMSLPVQV